ncbi:hypothetical protein PPROV_000563800 [Pycnococcus provasolii]|uniref:Histone-lysine N-methyltransferase NSD-like PHD zinc finger domain-containing protein n=3 Tax=Pycnococcus provasolii TaxID=41880 RepID=A0A830HID8_9CHLO|nr:hypothetical protein PPROV_000563800 [Pycnococcus provasolii]
MSSPHHHSGPPSFPGVPHCLGGAPGARGGAGGGGAPAWPPGGRPGAASSPGGGKRTARGGTSSSVQPGFLPASLLQGGAVRAVVTKPEDKTRVDDVQQQTAYRNINEEEPCLARQVQQQTAKRTPQEDEEARPSSSQGQGGNNPPAHVNNPLCVDVDVDVPGRDLNMPEQNTHTPAATNDDDDVPASDPANNNTDTQQHHNADAADAPSSAAAEAPPHSSTTPPPPQRAPSSPPPPTLSRLRSTSAKELDDEALARRLSVALNARPRRTAVVTTVPTKIQRQASVGGELVDGEPVCFACKRTHSSAGLVPDVPCCHAGCYKMYHAHCVKLGGATGPNNRGLVKVTMKGKRWVCGHHVCADGMDDGNGALVTCAMCPTAYASERVPKTFVRDSDESCVGLCHTCACVVAAAVDSRTKITARSGSQGDEVVLREELSAARRYWEQVAQPTIERTLNPHEAPPPPPPVPPPLPPPRTQPQAQKTRARHNDRRNDEGDDEDEEEAQQQTEEEEEEEEEEEVEEEPRSALNQFDCPLYAAPPPRRAANKGIQRFDPSAPVNVGAFANTKSRKTTTTTTKTAVARAPPKGSSSSLPSKSRSTTNTPSDVIMPPPPPPPRRVLDRNVRLDEVDMVDGDEVRDKKTESVKVSAPTSRKRKQEQQRVSAKSKKRVSKGERMTNRAAGAACAAPMNTYDDVDDGDDHVDYDDDEAEIDDVVNEDAAVKCLMGLADAPMVGANVHNTTTTKQPTKQTRESSKPKRNNTGTPTSTLTPKPTRPTTAITPETKQQPKLVSAKVQAQAQATRVVPLDTIPRKLAKPKSPPAVTITPTTEGVHSTDVVASPSASETQAAGIDAIAVARAAAAAAMRPFWKKQQSGDGKKSVEEKVCSDEATTVPLLEVAPRSVSQAWPDDEKAAGEDLSRGGEKSVGRSRSRSRSPVRNSGPSEEELSILCALESGFVTRNDLMNLVRMKKLDAANQAIVSLANGPEARRLGITAAYCICQLDVSPCIAEAAHRQMEASRTAGLPTPNVAIRVLPFIGEKWQCDV